MTAQKLNKRIYTRKKGVGTHKPFTVTSVCKEDLLHLLDEGKLKIPKWRIKKLNEATMKRIASKLSDDYCEQLFWSSLEIIADKVIEDMTTKDNK